MKRWISIAMMVSFLGSITFAQDLAAKRKAAEQAAQTWLALVDSGNYGESWQQAAPFLQAKISKQDWQSTLDKTRSPLGTANHRTLARSAYQTDLPNAPKGEYVIVQYKTALAAGMFVETLTLQLGSGGKWRVAGYFIKPELL